MLLDGDRMREGLCSGLGFSDNDRTENLRRAAEVARLATESGITVVVACITPRALQRRMIRRIVGPRRLTLVYLDAELKICQQRDTKGLYAQAREGQLKQLTGVSAIFEVPRRPQLIVPSGSASQGRCAKILIEFACSRLGLRKAEPKALRRMSNLSPPVANGLHSQIASASYQAPSEVAAEPKYTQR